MCYILAVIDPDTDVGRQRQGGPTVVDAAGLMSSVVTISPPVGVTLTSLSAQATAAPRRAR